MVRRLETTGLPMGMMLPAGVGGDYPETEVRLAPDDLLVLYSDGIPEAQGVQGEFYEEDRLREAVRKGAGEMGAQPLVHEIVGDVTAFRGEVSQLDDMTVVVLRYLGQEGA